MRSRAEVLGGLPSVGKDIYVVAVEWLYGTSPAKTEFRHEVRDPPNCGWGIALLIDREVDDRGRPMKLVTLFALSWFDSWQVSRASLEYQSLKHPEEHRVRAGTLRAHEYEAALKSRMTRRIPATWRSIESFGWQKDFDTAALILRKMGEEVPFMQARDGGEAKVSGGKEADALGLAKPVKRSSRKGQVLAFFWPDTKSIREAMAEMGISRSNVLSQLYLLTKDHGIGYELKGDAAIIAMPAGCSDPWEA